MTYVKTCVPEPARIGLKEVPEIPGPDNVPPAGETTTGTTPPFEHKVANAAIVGTGIAVIVTEAVAVTAGQPLDAAIV